MCVDISCYLADLIASSNNKLSAPHTQLSLPTLYLGASDESREQLAHDQCQVWASLALDVSNTTSFAISLSQKEAIMES